MPISGTPLRGKATPKTSLMNLSVEEENLAAIPFAVLERRVGKRLGKIEINGSQTLPDGTKVEVSEEKKEDASVTSPPHLGRGKERMGC